MIREVLFHPFGITVLAGSVLMAGALRFLSFLPLAGDLDGLAPEVVFLGLTGYTALVVTLLWPVPEGSRLNSGQVEDDLSDSTVKGRLRSEAVRHPVTLLALASAAVSVSFLALVEPDFGIGPLVQLTGGMGLMVGVGSLLWQSVVRHRQRYSGMVLRMTNVSAETKARAETEALVQLREDLESGFPEVGFELGINALRGLDDEFFKLGLAMDSHGMSASISLAAVPALARETYHRGLSVLGDVLQLMRAVDGPTREQLESGIKTLEGEIRSSESDDDQRNRALILKDTLAIQRQRLVMEEQLRLRADQLLHLANRCEATLNLTRIQVASIRAGGLESGVEPAVDALQETVRRAKEVQDELQKLGY